MLSLFIGYKNPKKSGLSLRKGKLRVIEGRKAVRPMRIGRLPEDLSFSIPGKFAWDFFYNFFKVPGINKKVPGINRKKNWNNENFPKVNNAEIAESISAKYFILCDGAGNLWAANF